MLGQRVWLGIGVAGVLAARLTGGAESMRPAPQHSPAPASSGLRVFGAARAQEGRHITGGRLDGALAQISQRYASIATDHPLAALHAINPAARFRQSAPLAIPEVLIDAVTTGDTQALKSALQKLGLSDGATFSNDVDGWLPVDQILPAAGLTELRFARASMPRT